MRIAIRELWRKPGRFAIAGTSLTLLVLLLLFLGGLLDGLYLGSTGAIRSVDADSIVFSNDSRESFLRSSVGPAERTAIEGVPGVTEVGGLGLTLLGVTIPGETDIVDGSITAFELSSESLPAPPAPGTAYADDRLESLGASIGDVVKVGPAEVPLEIVGWVSDSNYLLQNGLWVDPATWRDVQNANRPDAPVQPDEFQVFVVRGDVDGDGAALSTAIDDATGTTTSLSEDEAVLAVPGVKEQVSTFNAILGVTIFVVGLVVGLFFALLVLERTGIYAVLKAVGAPSRRLVAGVVTQSVAVALGAYLIGGTLTWLLSLVIPPAVPFEFAASRAVGLLVAVLAASIVGALVTFRRIIRIDPATAIGGGV